jgi:hypothetical protein
MCLTYISYHILVLIIVHTTGMDHLKNTEQQRPTDGNCNNFNVQVPLRFTTFA